MVLGNFICYLTGFNSKISLLFSILKYVFSVCVIVAFTSTSYAQASTDSTNLFHRQFQSAKSFAVDPSQNIFIVDVESNSLLKFSPDGKLLHTVSGYGWTNTSFDQPMDVAAPNGLDIYVADYGNHRIQRFDKNLNYVSTFSLRENENPEKRFGYPKSVAVDRFGSLYIVDGENYRIVKVKGNVVERVFGGVDAGAGKLTDPSKVRVTDDDKVYVFDKGGLLVFDVFGNFIRKYDRGIFPDMHALSVNGSSVTIIDSCRIVSLSDNMQENPGCTENEAMCNAIDFFITENGFFFLNEKSFETCTIPRQRKKK